MVTVFPIRLPGRRLLCDVVTTYAGFLANAIFGFITLMLMAKYLGPGDFGVATLANMFMAVIAGLGEPGVGTALVRLASKPGVTAEAGDKMGGGADRLKLDVGAAGFGLASFPMPWIYPPAHLPP